MKDKQVYCNQCRKEISLSGQEDFFHGSKAWGYFSKKDLMQDDFYLCEDCYDHMISQFQIPVCRTERKEVL